MSRTLTTKTSPSGTLTRAHMLPYLTIDSYTCRESLFGVAVQLRAAGVSVERDDLYLALIEARAYPCPVNRMMSVPNAVRPTFAFDNLQDALQDALGVRTSAMGRPWEVVMGHLRIRWAAGNHAAPSTDTMLRWVRAALPELRPSHAPTALAA